MNATFHTLAENACTADIIKPFLLTLVKGELLVSALPRFLPLAQTVVDELGKTEAAFSLFDALTAELSTEILTLGYQNDSFSTAYGYILQVLQPPQKPLKTDFLSPIRIKSVDNYRNLTTIDLKPRLHDGCEAYATVQEGNIVSLAVAHAVASHDGSPALAEITVETLPAMRGRGYGTACVAALTCALCERGITPQYRCRAGNTASLALARRAGFTEVGCFYHFIGRRIDRGIR